MKLEDMILISVDDHVVEPPDTWKGRVPKKYADRVPKLITQDSGTDAWEYLGQQSANAGCTVGTRRAEASDGYTGYHRVPRPH